MQKLCKKLFGNRQGLAIKAGVLDKIVGCRVHEVVKVKGKIIVAVYIQPSFKHEQRIGAHMPDAQAVDRSFRVDGKQRNRRICGVRMIQVLSAWRNRKGRPPSLWCAGDGKCSVIRSGDPITVGIKRIVRHGVLSWRKKRRVAGCVGAR